MPTTKLSQFLDTLLYSAASFSLLFTHFMDYVNHYTGFFMVALGTLTFLFNENRKQRIQKIIESKLEKRLEDPDILKLLMRETYDESN